MDKMILKVARISPDGIIPTHSYQGDLGYDLYSNENVVIPKGGQVLIKTGISVQFPIGWGGFIKDRSSKAIKKMYTSAGVIDNGYRGEVKVVIRNGSASEIKVSKGEKIAQLIPLKTTDWNILEVTQASLSESERDDKGFGSSGK